MILLDFPNLEATTDFIDGYFSTALLLVTEYMMKIQIIVVVI